MRPPVQNLRLIAAEATSSRAAVSVATRCFSSIPGRSLAAVQAEPRQSPSPIKFRISELRARIGKCIIFGLTQPQIDEAGEISRILAREWRDLVAGSEGFLTDRAIIGRAVEWGSMVSILY